LLVGLHTQVLFMDSTTTTQSDGIALVPVKDLLRESFLIPSYQRGYRWSKRQVTDLLKDLQSFYELSKPEDFYCLQPVIVKRKGAQWEVVDGQQRLTTIAILLQYIREQVLKSAAVPFTLTFATRPGSEQFLQQIDSSRRHENVDFYYIVQAWEAIAEWFANQEDLATVAMTLYPTLRNRTKVIWYELGSETVEQEVFGRINSGKIPLTNAELIKALFLQQRPALPASEQRQLTSYHQEIAREWDAIEAQLQRNELWYFLTGAGQEQATRIDLLFELLAGTHQKKDAYATFDYFQKKLSKATFSQLQENWQQVQALFALLESWYQDRQLYHQVGYLIAADMSLTDLVAAAKECSKRAFSTYLTGKIKERVAGDWDNLHYGSDNRELRNVLLLFNIETLRQNKTSSYRFPFHFYKGNGGTTTTWSLEHIHPQRPQGLNGSADYRAWLSDMRRFLSDSPEASPAADELGRQDTSKPTNLAAEVDRLLGLKEISKVEFETLQENIMARFGEPGLNTLDNLALLARNDNAMLNNGTFPQKRARIIELEKRGAFIPITTRNVFLKYYTPENLNLNYWTRTDRECYREAISETLKDYLTA